MDIVSRSEWGGAAHLQFTPMTLPSQALYLHHSATEAWHGPAGVRACEQFHMRSRGYTAIGYSFLVDVDGVVYEGRGAGVVGAHTLNWNSKAHAICCLGDFTTTTPPAPMLAAVADLVAHGHRQGWWPNTITGGHRDAPGNQTSCPGDLLERRIHDLRSMVAQRLARPTPTEDDMTPEQAAMLSRVHHELVSMQPGTVKHELGQVKTLLAAGMNLSSPDGQGVLAKLDHVLDKLP